MSGATRERLERVHLGSDELLGEAERLAFRIVETHTRDEQGGVNWISLRTLVPEQPARLAPVGPHLYGGSTGIAFFLAAFMHVSGLHEQRSFVLEILDPLRQRLAAIAADPARAAALRLGLGGMIGLGAFAYAFHRIGGWLSEPSLVRESQDLLSLFTTERIMSDQLLDVVGGSAGGLLSLLAVSPSAGDESVAARAAAIACGTRLVSTLLWKDNQPAGWRTLPWCSPLGGFSHGAAGICYALFRLYERTKDEALWEAAREGLVFERDLYDPAKKNWRDLRSPKAGFSVCWCHGAPGVALGRIAALHIMDSEEIRAEINDGLETTRTAALDDLDHVCCGNFGRVEVLHYAARKLGRPDLLEEAFGLAERVLQRARSRGRYGWDQDPTVKIFDPSFFTGAAGLGYSLLRLARPDLLPCVLLLD